VTGVRTSLAPGIILKFLHESGRQIQISGLYL
jgi:hypothetical protein